MARHPPEKIDFYDVSEDQLAMLEMQHRDISSEVMWVASGGVVGALPASADAIWRYYQSPLVFSVPDLIQLFIFAGAFVTSLVMLWLRSRTEKDKKSIFDKIRAQKKEGH